MGSGLAAVIRRAEIESVAEKCWVQGGREGGRDGGLGEGGSGRC